MAKKKPTPPPTPPRPKPDALKRVHGSEGPKKKPKT